VFRGVLLDTVLYAVARVAAGNGANAGCHVLAGALAPDFVTYDSTYDCARHSSQYLFIVLDGLLGCDDLVSAHFV
jgi:hypothetical protein